MSRSGATVGFSIIIIAIEADLKSETTVERFVRQLEKMVENNV